MRPCAHVFAVVFCALSLSAAVQSDARAQGWGTAAIIDGGANDATMPHVAFDGQGKATAVFQQTIGANTRILANRYSASAWGTAQAIDAGPGNNAADGQVACDPNGNAIAVFDQYLSGTRRIYANLWNGSSWSGAQLRDAGNQTALEPQVSFDASGNAFTVFRQKSAGTDRIYANRWNGSSWGGAQIIDTGAANPADGPQIAFDATGRAFAVFRKASPDWRSYAVRYDGSAWEPLPAPVDAGGASFITYQPHVAAYGGNRAIAVFSQNTIPVTLERVYANRYNGTAWTGATVIDAATGGDAQQPRIAADSSGNALAIFRQMSGGIWRLYANRFDGSSWSGAQTVDAATGFGAVNASLAMDKDGNAIVVFTQSDGSSNHVYANRWNGSSWSGAQIIDAGTGRDVKLPDVAFDKDGNAMAVFVQADATNDRIYANYYTAHAPPTPTPVPQAEIVLNGTTFSAGQPFQATFRLNRSVEQPFTAYAVVQMPDGFMLDALTLGPEIKPVASNVPRLDAPFTYPLLNLNIPAGAPLGNYQVMAGFFTPGQPITGPQDAFLLATGPFEIH